jgi:uncharacterized membrane protein YbhN (UPF0104 family)
VKSVPWKKILVLMARIACVVAIFTLIFRKIAFPSLGQFETSAFVVGFIIAVLLNLAQSVLCTYRWRWVALHSYQPPGFRLSFFAYLEGAFFNQALPSFVGGDTVRIVRWAENGIPPSRAAASVLLDRVSGAWGASILALIACALIMGSPIEPYKLGLTALLAAGVSVACILVVVLTRMQFLVELAARYRRLGALAHAIGSWRPGMPGVAYLTGLGVGGQVMSGLAVCALARGLGIDAPMAILVSITGIILLLSMIPVSLAGWGVREAGFIAFLVPLGVPAGSALALGLTFGLSGLAGALPGGVSILCGMALGRRAEERPSIGE